MAKMKKKSMMKKAKKAAKKKTGVRRPAKVKYRDPNDSSNTWTGRIRGLIGRDFSKPMPDFDWIAQELHTSPQTLRRRLKQENTSFQEIKDLLRRDMAIYYLSHQELPINDIAERVGFTEPSTFHRAFKKWTGVTPGAWREGERGDLVQ